MGDKGLSTTQAQRRASLKWEHANNDKLTIKLRKDGRDGFTADDVRRAAANDGQAVNRWLIDAIKDKL